LLHQSADGVSSALLVFQSHQLRPFIDVKKEENIEKKEKRGTEQDKKPS
jgi:hypothetical protein